MPKRAEKSPLDISWPLFLKVNKKPRPTWHSDQKQRGHLRVPGCSRYSGPLRPSRVTTASKASYPEDHSAFRNYLEKKHTQGCNEELSFGTLQKHKTCLIFWFALLSKKKTTPFFGSWVSFSVSLSENRGFKINPFCNPMTFKFNCDKSLIAKQPTKQWTPRRATKARCFYMFLPHCVEVPRSFYLVSIGRIYQIIPTPELFVRIHLQSPPFGGITWKCTMLLLV